MPSRSLRPQRRLIVSMVLLAGTANFSWGQTPAAAAAQAIRLRATVDEVMMGSSANTRTLMLKYKDGEKTLFVPPEAPVVTFKPGGASLLVAGAKIIVTAELRDGKPTALRVTAGRKGFQPPM